MQTAGAGAIRVISTIWSGSWLFPNTIGEVRLHWELLMLPQSGQVAAIVPLREARNSCATPRDSARWPPTASPRTIDRLVTRCWTVDRCGRSVTTALTAGLDAVSEPRFRVSDNSRNGMDRFALKRSLRGLLG